MNARALICRADQSFAIEDVTVPGPAPDQVAIRTAWSGVSIGTEFALVRAKISWGPYPLCTGYMGTGEIEAVGDAVTGFAPGDRVYFRGCDAMTLADGSRVSCVSGAHCSRVVLKPNTAHGVDHVPDGVMMDAAAMFVLPSVGLHGVDMANPRAGQSVVVHGAGLIGLGVVAASVHRGCVVTAIDQQPRPLALAREMGADHVVDARQEPPAAAVARLFPGGADVVFECTGVPACLDTAIPLCRPGGTFVWQGNYGEAPVSLHFMPAHGRQLTMVFPCDDGLQPCRRAVMRNMASGALRWDRAITHRVDAEDAPSVFTQINRGSNPELMGVVVKWEETA